jgi:hypothetical protein
VIFVNFSIMPKATDSQEKTLAAATILLLGQGFHGSALQTILATGEAPRRLALLPLSRGQAGDRRGGPGGLPVRPWLQTLRLRPQPPQALKSSSPGLRAAWRPTRNLQP